MPWVAGMKVVRNRADYRSSMVAGERILRISGLDEVNWASPN